MRLMARQAAALIASILVAACAANAGEKPQVRTVDEINLQQGFALKGYDPVAYFTEKRPMVGDSQYQYEWDGAVYRFASAKHLALFKSDPDRYLPQYNNWCAASMAKGVKVGRRSVLVAVPRVLRPTVRRR